MRTENETNVSIGGVLASLLVCSKFVAELAQFLALLGMIRICFQNQKLSRSAWKAREVRLRRKFIVNCDH